MKRLWNMSADRAEQILRFLAEDCEARFGDRSSGLDMWVQQIAANREG